MNGKYILGNVRGGSGFFFWFERLIVFWKCLHILISKARLLTRFYFHCWEKLSHTDIGTLWNINYYITMYYPSLKDWNLSFCAIKGWVRAVPPTPYLLYFTAFPFWLYESFRDEKTKERVSSLTLNASRALITICFVLKCLNVLIWLSI